MTKKKRLSWSIHLNIVYAKRILKAANLNNKRKVKTFFKSDMAVVICTSELFVLLLEYLIRCGKNV